MDLQSGGITLGELARDPKARALINQEFPGILNHPLAGMFLGLTLNQAMAKFGNRVPQQKVRRLLKELAKL